MLFISCFLTSATKMLHKLREKCPNAEFFWSTFSRIWTEYGNLNLCIQSKCKKIRTRKTPYLDNFYVVTDFVDAFDLKCNSTLTIILFNYKTKTSGSTVSKSTGRESHAFLKSIRTAHIWLQLNSLIVLYRELS